MALIKINTRPTPATLRQFGLIWLGFFAVVGGLTLWRSGTWPAATALWAAAVVVPAVGWIVPPFMRLVYLGMSYAAWPIGTAISFALLAAFYFLLVTPVGFVMRLLGRDPLNRRFAHELDSYWLPRRPERPVSDYLRQF